MTTTPLNPTIFRPGSSLNSPRPVNFILTLGGIGDYIAWCSSILWIAKTHPQVHGNVYCAPYFMEFVQNIIKPFPHWQTHPNSTFDVENNKFPTYYPTDRPINGTGCHPLDLGFIYFANMNPPPKEDNFYPILDLSDTLPPLTTKNTAIVTPGSTYPNRTLPAKTFNAINTHLLAKGIIPIALGKSQVGSRAINFENDYDFSNIVDLRDKTTLLQAAKIISNSKLIIGLDNGLLHLAACTTTPIIFGYNIASPEHRRPRRKQGDIYEIYPDTQKLTCTFCQSKMRFMFTHDFSKCMYEDMKCLEMLSDPKPWCDLIDQCLEEKK